MFKLICKLLKEDRQKHCEHDFSQVLDCSWCAYEGARVDLGIGNWLATLRKCGHPKNPLGNCLPDVLHEYDLTKCIKRMKICRKCDYKELA